MRRPGFLEALTALWVASASSLPAQGLPAYVPINPVTTSRSALYFQPVEALAPRWRATLQFDWSSLIEHQRGAPFTTRGLVDAEILRLDATVVRDLGPDRFVLASIGVAHVSDGVLDAFFDWFHTTFGFPGGHRNRRPRNEFEYRVRTPDGGCCRPYERPALMLTDSRLGLGIRHSAATQSLLFITLPTTTHSRGYGRGVGSANAVITARVEPEPRMHLEGSVGLGWTPRHGELAAHQRVLFWSASGGGRYRFWGRQALFFNVFFQSAGYRGMELDGYDRYELTGDMGFLLRPGRNWPELILALTEDLKPSGSAVDATFRIGLRW